MFVRLKAWFNLGDALSKKWEHQQGFNWCAGALLRGARPEQIEHVIEEKPNNPQHNAGAMEALNLWERQIIDASSFQERMASWLLQCFGDEIAHDTQERNHRFLEESLELVQACGCTASEAHQLVDYVYGRAVGVRAQEVGGVMTTLAALCFAQGLNLQECAETELARIWTKIAAIRAKQAGKPKHSPLPGPSETVRAVDNGVVDY